MLLSIATIGITSAATTVTVTIDGNRYTHTYEEDLNLPTEGTVQIPFGYVNSGASGPYSFQLNWHSDFGSGSINISGVVGIEEGASNMPGKDLQTLWDWFLIYG